MAMMKGPRPGTLFDSLSKNVLKTLLILQVKADKHITTEDLVEAKHNMRGKEEGYKRKEPDSRRIDYKGNLKSRKYEIDARKRYHDRRLRTPPC